MNNTQNEVSGASRDAIFLVIVRVVTILLGMSVTRILAETLSITDYGTYSQVMLMVSTITTLSVLGMVDGANYFFYNCKNVKEREEYISSIFTLQYIIGIVVGIIIFISTIPIIHYFKNEDLKRVLIFVMILPLIQNVIAILQVLFIAIGKAKQIAVRNFIFSVSRLILFSIACHIFNSIITIFIFTILMDFVQIVYFRYVLKKNQCNFSIRKTNIKLFKKIIKYCAPMAAFLILSTLTRDCDRYVVSAFTDTETLAVYTNAAKILPFDIIMASFCTVLLPFLTKYIVEAKYEKAQRLYGKFMELSYITTTIFACGAIVGAPMLMELLYSKKYLAGISVFVIYIVVDIFRFTNMTLILSASGKTKSLMYISAGTLALNFILNIVMFRYLYIVGPAISTLIVTVLSGIFVQYKSINILKGHINEVYDFKYMIKFFMRLIICMIIFGLILRVLNEISLHYFVKLVIVSGGFIIITSVLELKRILGCLKSIGSYRLES